MPKPPTPNQTPSPKRPKVTFDWQAWLPYLEDTNATDDEKRELIETLWSIVVCFVDLGWEVGSNPEDPEETGGQKPSLGAALRAAVVQSKEQQEEEAV